MPKDWSRTLKAVSLKTEVPDLGSSSWVGPIGIAKLLAHAVKESPARVMIINSQLAWGLGLFNLLPLPFLDGGNLVKALLFTVVGNKPELVAKLNFVIFVVGFLAFMFGRDLWDKVKSKKK